jgi:hypothetical protein
VRSEGCASAGVGSSIRNSVCEGAGLSHWHVSRVFGPDNWQLVFLYACRRWSQRRLAQAFGVALSLICRRLQRLRERLRKADLQVGPTLYFRRGCRTNFSDCEGRDRTSLIEMIAYFERPERVK